MNGFQIDAVNNALDELRAENAELRAANKLLRTAYLVPEDKVLLAENERLIAARDAAMRVHVEDGAEIERLQNLILGACNIFCNLDAPHWAAEFRRALEKPDGGAPQT